jgi:hypothetical protein
VLQRLLGAVTQYTAMQGVVTTTSTFVRPRGRRHQNEAFHLVGHAFDDVVSLLWRVHPIVVPTTDLWLPPLGAEVSILRRGGAGREGIPSASVERWDRTGNNDQAGSPRQVSDDDPRSHYRPA